MPHELEPTWVWTRAVPLSWRPVGPAETPPQPIARLDSAAAALPPARETDCIDQSIQYHTQWQNTNSKWLNGLHIYIYSAFLTSGHSKHFTILPHIHPFMHTFKHRQRCQPCKGEVPCSGTPWHSRRSQGFEPAISQLPANPGSASWATCRPRVHWRRLHPRHA